MTEITFDATSRFVKTGDVTIHLNDLGEGPPVVLLHGSGPGASSWSNFKQNLPALTQHFRCLAVDQPGFGRSEKPEFRDQSFYKVTSNALLSLLDELGLDKVDFIGNSLGGASALRFALDHPDRTRKLLLMGPGGAAVNIFTTVPSEGIKLLNRFYDPPGPSRERLEDFIRIMVYDQSLITDELIDERFAVAKDPEVVAGSKRAIDSFSRPSEDDQLWRSLHKIRHEVLMTWGRDDRVLPLDNAFFALRRMPNARLHVFPRCGHWAQVEHQAEFDELAVAFFRRG